MTCKCHNDDSLYGQLGTCPKCNHRSYDWLADACERRACGYATERIGVTSTEAPFSATFKVPPRDRDGDLWTARGNTIEEFKANVEALKEYLGGEITEQQAIQNLQNSGLVSSNPGMQTVAQPGFTQQQAAANDFPPGVEYPGDCPHGRRTYKPAETTKNGKRISARFECAIPWQRGNDHLRCDRSKTVWIKD